MYVHFHIQIRHILHTVAASDEGGRYRSRGMGCTPLGGLKDPLNKAKDIQKRSTHSPRLASLCIIITWMYHCGW